MVTVKVKLVDQTDSSLLGNVALTLSEMDYNRLVQFVTPAMLEKFLKPSGNDDEAMPEIKEALYQKKDTLKNAVQAFVKAIPNKEKEELMAAFLKEDMLKDKANEALKKTGLTIECGDIVSESQGE